MSNITSDGFNGRRKVCIIGCGVVGLSVANLLLESESNISLTIMRNKQIEEATSWGPAGLFRPSLRGNSRAVIKKWAKLGFSRLLQLYRSEDNLDQRSGIQLISGYIFSNDYDWLQDQEDLYGNIVLNFRWLTTEEVRALGSDQRYGIFYSTFTSEGQRYVPWLIARVQKFGARIVEQNVWSLIELTDDFDVIINCAGIGASVITDNAQIQPQRGALLQVRAPWLKHFLFVHNKDQEDTYLIPGIETVFLGTFRQLGNRSLQLKLAEKEDLWSRGVRLCPSIHKASVVKEWVGLRPFRADGVCLRRTDFSHRGRQITVIDNYGHGGNGFTISWGTAHEVLNMFRQQTSFVVSKSTSFCAKL